MMKRIFTLLATICVLLSLVACGETTKKETADKAKETTITEEKKSEEKKAERTLIFKAKNGRLFLKEAKDLEFDHDNGKTYTVDLKDKKEAKDGNFEIKLDDKESLKLTKTELSKVEEKIEEVKAEAKSTTAKKDTSTTKKADEKKSDETEKSESEKTTKKTEKAGEEKTTSTTKKASGDSTERTTARTTRAVAPASTTVRPASTTARPASTTARPASTTAHTHNWQAVYRTVNIPEKGHWETVVVTPAWTETVTEPVYEEIPVAVFHADGYIARTREDCLAHSRILLDQGLSDSFYSDWLYEQTGTTTTTINHPAVTEQKWIVDTPATTKQELSHYVCSGCGETK